MTDAVPGGAVRNEQFGEYLLQEVIGRGGMGEVFRAYDTERRRIVALKRLPATLAEDEAFRRRFRTESEIAARLNDPHVLPIHNFGDIDGRLFIDMRYVDGADLAGVIRRHGALDPEKAVDVLAQVASALDAAHADGLVHRDVKASNILVTVSGADEAPGFAYLTDFGVAQVGGADTSLSTTNATVGTLDYMAPERFTDRRVDHRVDVYALGCLLHEMLTGDKPFPADTMPQAMHAHIYSEPPRPSEARPDVPTGLDGVVARAMAKSPGDRYETCGQMAADARAQLPTRAGPSPVEQIAPEPAEPVVGAGQGRPAAAGDTPGEVDVRTTPRERTQERDPSPSRIHRVPQAIRRRPVVTALTALAAAVAITVAVVLADFAADPGEGLAAPAPSSGPGPSSGAPVVVPTPAVEGVFAGRSSGNEMTVAIATEAGQVAAYLCDGEAVEAWMDGTLAGRELRLRSAKGAVLEAMVTDDAAFGTISVAGRTFPFSAERAPAPAGLYEARTGTTRTGWIVLQDGSQVGLSQTNGVSTPAPRLDPQTRTAVGPDGPVTAAPLTGAE